MTWLIIAAIITILILFNALYVGAEFATVSSRKSRLAKMADEGNRFALMLTPIVDDPVRLDTYVAACQIGITISSLVLGFYGQRALTPIIAPLLSGLGAYSQTAAQSISATVALLFLTTLQVILGELVPKSIGIQYPERLAVLTALPMRWSIAVFRPLIWLFNGSGRLILDALDFDPATETHVHAPQEIIMLVEESRTGGLLDEQEQRLLNNTLRLRELVVRQVMIPRTQMLAAPADAGCEELLTMLADSRHSRLPLYEESVDDIVGIVHLKDLLCLHREPGTGEVRDAMRDIPFVPETLPVGETLALLQREHYHVAIVLDEFGGTAGMVTLEDLIEEIFGELQDEFDTEQPHVQALSSTRVLVRGDTLLADLNDRLDLSLYHEDVDTIGGLVLSETGHVPRVGDELDMDKLTVRVEKMARNRVAAVSFSLPAETVATWREQRE